MTDTITVTETIAMTMMTTTPTVSAEDFSPSILTTSGLATAPETSLENCGEGNAAGFAGIITADMSRSRST